MRTTKKTRLMAYALASCLSPGIGILTVQEANAQQTYNYTGGVFPPGWDTAGNWTPNGVPGLNDTARIGLQSGGTPATIFSDSTKTISELLVWQAANLTTSNDLSVTGTTTVDDGSLIIWNGDTFTTDTLLVTGGSSSVLVREALVINGSATIDTGNSISTTNTTPPDNVSIHLGPGATSFNNNGAFSTAASLTTLTADSGSYNLSGSNGTGTVNVTSGLTVDAPLSTFTGTMSLANSAIFDSSLAWSATGTIALGNSSTIQGGALSLSGAADLTVGGNISFTEDAVIKSDLTVGGTTSITIGSQDSLTLEGVTTFNDGSIDGEDLVLENNATFNDGAVSVNELHIASGRTVTFNPGASLEVSDFLGLSIESNGTLNINRTSFGQVDLNLPRINLPASATLNLSTEHVDGAILEEPLILWGAVNAKTITTGLPTRFETNELLAFKMSSASVTASSLDASFISLDSNVSITLDYEVIAADLGLDSDATLNLDGPSTIRAFGTPSLALGSELRINDSLALNKQVEFSGMGSLIVAENASLAPVGKAVVLAVDVTNNGTLAINKAGFNTRDLTIGNVGTDRSYTQSSFGTLELVIEGSDASEHNYDDIDVYGDVDLAGTLDIDDGSYTMVAGDTYRILEILSTAGDITGTFDTVTGLPAYSSLNTEMSGLFYNSTSVDILTVIAGDLDGDGFVGNDDLQLVLGNFNTSVPMLAFSQGDANGDAFVGIDDLNAVLNNWNNGTPPSVSATIPEPSALALLSLGGLAMLRRTRD